MNSEHKEVIYKLLELAEGFPSMWKTLDSEGFHLSKMLFSEIESMRTRAEGELPFLDYCLEKTKENIGLYGISVPPKATSKERYELSYYKSEYLNILQNKYDNNEIEIFEKYPQYSRLYLDPNYILYASLRIRDNELFLKKLLGQKKQILKEVSYFSTQTQKYNQTPHKITPTRILSLLQDVLSPSGLKLIISDKRKGWFVFQRVLSDDLSIYCEYEDHYGMKKGSSWSLSFSFAPSNVKFKYGTWATKIYFHLNASFLPLGYFYMNHDDSWDQVLLGAFLAGRNMDLIIKKCEKIFSFK